MGISILSFFLSLRSGKIWSSTYACHIIWLICCSLLGWSQSFSTSFDPMLLTFCDWLSHWGQVFCPITAGHEVSITWREIVLQVKLSSRILKDFGKLPDIHEDLIAMSSYHDTWRSPPQACVWPEELQITGRDEWTIHWYKTRLSTWRWLKPEWCTCM